MKWFPAQTSLRSTTYASAAGDSMLEDLRRALVLVGVSRTLEDPVSIKRAIGAARFLLKRVERMDAATPLGGAQRERVQRGIRFLTRALATESTLQH